MGSLIDFLTEHGIGERFARLVASLLLAATILALVGSAKCGYDFAVLNLDADARQAQA